MDEFNKARVENVHVVLCRGRWVDVNFKLRHLISLPAFISETYFENFEKNFNETNIYLDNILKINNLL